MARLKKFKESAEFEAMSEDEKMKALKEKIAAMKEIFKNDDDWRRDDDDQRKKAGYFAKMRDGARKVYDDKDDKFRSMRGKM